MSQQKTTISIIIKKRSKVFQPSSVTKSETRNQGNDDWEGWAARQENTLSLRVARSGTKRPVSARLGAKNRRLLKVFLCSYPCIAIFVRFWTRFARSTLST